MLKARSCNIIKRDQVMLLMTRSHVINEIKSCYKKDHVIHNIKSCYKRVQVML